MSDCSVMMPHTAVSALALDKGSFCHFAVRFFSYCFFYYFFFFFTLRKSFREGR